MFTRIQARHYRSLKFIDQPLDRFEALVGPNASGKSTFLDLFAFLSDLMRSRGNVREATYKRSADFSRLLWNGEGSSFQIAVEASIPEDVRTRMAQAKQKYGLVRYEVEIGIDASRNEIGVNHEILRLLANSVGNHVQSRTRQYAEVQEDDPERIFFLTDVPGMIETLPLVGIVDGRVEYYSEALERGEESFSISHPSRRKRSALANVLDDPDSFPVSLWFREFLENGIQSFILNSQVMREPSPPGLGLRFQPDGSNLPWAIDELARDQTRFSDWLDHVRTALEEIRDIRTVERPEDRHRYLMIDYANGATVPSWLVSDGTLCLLALTILPYLKDMNGVYLIEEPENGIHPQAGETVIQSLTSIYDGQVLITTHSPGVVGQLELEQILCFAKDEDGATEIISGDRHPRLSDWKRGQPDLSVLFASGILS